jgi:hypothetical protein
VRRQDDAALAAFGRDVRDHPAQRSASSIVINILLLLLLLLLFRLFFFFIIIIIIILSFIIIIIIIITFTCRQAYLHMKRRATGSMPVLGSSRKTISGLPIIAIATL